MQFQTKCNLPAKFRKAVVVACDKNFAPYALFLLHQILQLEKGRKFDVCLVSQDSLWKLPFIASDQIRFIHLLDFDTVGHLPTNQNSSRATYLRLFLPAILSAEYDRILYLDSDIYLNRAGLSELLDTDMEHHSLAAVRDFHQAFSPHKQMPDFEKLGLKDIAYFNSGVLLIDCARFLDADLGNRCMEFVHRHPDIVGLIFHDQTALNGVLLGDWKELHPKWNWMYNLATFHMIEKENPCIIHFIGPIKPWCNLSGEVPQKYCDAYRHFLRIHFPSRADSMSPYQTTRKTKRRLWRFRLRRWFKTPRFQRYLAAQNSSLSEP